jgi:hypothetical protein
MTSFQPINNSERYFPRSIRIPADDLRRVLRALDASLPEERFKLSAPGVQAKLLKKTDLAETKELPF